MIIYLAYPIDSVAFDKWEKLERLKAEVHKQLQFGQDVAVYDPGSAWSGMHMPTAPVIQQVNHEALDRADVMFAIFPAWSTSVGVPLEIQRAVDAGKRVIVYRDHPSMALAELSDRGNLLQFTNIDLAVDAALAPLEPLSPRNVVVVQPDDGVDPERAFSRAYPDDAGFDLAYSGSSPIIVDPGQVVNVPCGIRVQWPAGMWALIIGRSSTFRNRELLVNISVIDPGYRGPMFVLVRNVGRCHISVMPGDRLAQLIPLPALAPGITAVVGQVDGGTRGENGFGSSGR